MKKAILFLFAVILFQSVQAGLLFPYNRLALKDLDQMNKLVQDKIRESQKSRGDQVIPLKEALQAVYSRPNEDYMIDKVISQLRNALDEHDAYEVSVRALVKEATGALKNPKAFNGVVQATYVIFLENLIADYKTKLSEGFSTEILEKIRDAKINLSKEAINERRLRMMKESFSPSELADKALKEYQENEKKKQKEKAEQEKKAAKETH